MNTIDVNRLLAQMEQMKATAQGLSAREPAATEAGAPDFAALLKNSIGTVSEMQQQATQLAETFEQGGSQVDLAQVMIALQKASLSFQTMVQVRNKLVTAYQEIMNMPM